MRDIHLHGHLADRFGPLHRLEVQSAAEAIKALCILHPGFKDSLKEGSFQIVRGDAVDHGFALPEDGIRLKLGSKPLHIVPQVEGSGRGAGKAILGVALIAGAFAFAPAVVGALGPTQGLGATAFTAFGSSVTYGNIASIGVSLALSGISAALSPRPKVTNLVQQDEKPSFLFNGAVNNSEQGGCVPVWYGGPIRVGSTIISGGLKAEQIGTVTA